MRYLNFFIAIFLTISITSATINIENNYEKFCEIKGHTVQNNKCLFSDGNNCELIDFYEGTCGAEYDQPTGKCSEIKEFCGTKGINCCAGLECKMKTQMGGECVHSKEICTNKCGDGKCQEIVCQGTGCPCTENKINCPADCQCQSLNCPGQYYDKEKQQCVCPNKSLFSRIKLWFTNLF